MKCSILIFRLTAVQTYLSYSTFLKWSFMMLYPFAVYFHLSWIADVCKTWCFPNIRIKSPERNIWCKLSKDFCGSWTCKTGSKPKLKLIWTSLFIHFYLNRSQKLHENEFIKSATSYFLSLLWVPLISVLSPYSISQLALLSSWTNVGNEGKINSLLSVLMPFICESEQDV